eukprot:g33179.t1
MDDLTSGLEHLESLRVIQAKLFPVVSSDEGYALIARKGFPPAAEDLGAWADVGALRGQRVTIQFLAVFTQTPHAWMTHEHAQRRVLQAGLLASTWLRAPTGVGWELKLEDFEDDDCIESPESDLLLHLMHELGGVFEKSFSKLESLRELELGDNQLRALDLENLDALRRLNVRNNCLGSLILPKSLEELDATGNCFERLPQLPSSLRTLWMAQNEAKTHADDFFASIKIHAQQQGPIPECLVHWRWAPVDSSDAQEKQPPKPEKVDEGRVPKQPPPSSGAEAVEHLRNQLESLDAAGAQKMLKQLFREWHPDKRQEAQKVMATRVFQWLQEVKDAWADFDRWAQDGRIEAMQQLAPAVLGRPYCEPGKLAWLATTCVLLLRGGAHDEALECAGSLDEDLLGKMTVLSLKHETRLHLVLRSPWPAFRLLDILARLIPENSSTRLGACKKNTMWNSDPDVFDWPLFKSMLADAATQLVSDESVFKLRSEDGPLSRQHTARLQKLVSIVANLVNVYGPVQQAARTDWAVWRLMHWASLLQRAHPDEIWQSTQENELTAAKDAALTLVTDVKQAVETVQAAKGAAEVIFVTSAWGWMSETWTSLHIA